MYKILLLLPVFLLPLFAISQQKPNLEKLFSYYKSGDVDIILNDLRAKKYEIQKEAKADTDFFDTQISCTYGSYNQKGTGFGGLVLMLIKKKLAAISYFCFDELDFKRMLREVVNRGYAQIMDNGGEIKWAFSYGDTLITAEKKRIEILNKQVDRYEICLAILATKVVEDKTK